MDVRYRRGTAAGDTAAMREFSQLAYPGRNSLPVQARLRRLIEVGVGLSMTAGDTARLASATLRALDEYGELAPAIVEVLEAFEAGDLRTEFREPMNLYLEGSAVATLAVAVCETCRPAIANTQPTGNPPDPVPVSPADVAEPSHQAKAGVSATEQQLGAQWPERTRDGFPQITLHVMVWWPGLLEWEAATLTAVVSPSLAFSGDNFTLHIEQEGDAEPARTRAVWMLRRDDLREELPVYELRASTWEMGDEPHEFRFLVASPSEWCSELHSYLATRWINKGLSPTGPKAFDSEAFGGDQPPVGPSISRPGSARTTAGHR
ncbi:MAG: hypothetical protein HKO63_10605 [Acidimicrobiia bacterium]|nr:hypothetical protein [Acidimicrobiia bacterium]NNF08811.1 hypothetical protein [Acidimicrobiia bacterium]NNL98643.1 hypothetical protein [Acidimicrobiia bacterium]RZV41536.1 MAG: hypothetical protein EX267_11020 [Acidimicrobiia bacterium]